MNDNDWNTYRREVMAALGDNKVELKALRSCVTEVKIEITKLHERTKMTARLWGALGGVMSVILALGVGITIWLFRGLASGG